MPTMAISGRGRFGGFSAARAASVSGTGIRGGGSPAAALGISTVTLWRMLKRHRLDAKDRA